MTSPALLFDMAPIGAGIGLIGGVAFFLVLAVIAFIAFLMLKKTLKMAFRIAIVGIILVIAIAGSIAIFVFGIGLDGGGGNRPGPPNRPKATQPK